MTGEFVEILHKCHIIQTFVAIHNTDDHIHTQSLPLNSSSVTTQMTRLNTLFKFNIERVLCDVIRFISFATRFQSIMNFVMHFVSSILFMVIVSCSCGKFYVTPICLNVSNFVIYFSQNQLILLFNSICCSNVNVHISENFVKPK